MGPRPLFRRDSALPQAPPHESAIPGVYYISQNHLYAVIWIGTCLAVSLTALRTWLQYSHNRRFYTNDYLIALALLFHIITSILYQLMGPPLYELEPVVIGVLAPNPSRIGYYNYYLRLQFAIQFTSWTTLWLVKLALLAFFWRLFDSVRTHARLFWWAMFGVTISTWVVAVFLHGFACQPAGSFFVFGGCLTPENVYRARLTFHFSSICDILTDFFIMLTPFPLLRKLQVNSHQRAILVVIFLTPSIVITFAILRLVKTNPPIGTVDPLPLALFSTVEISTSVIAACLPSIRLFFLTKRPKSHSDYHSLNYRQDGTSFPRPTQKNDTALELSNVADAFPSHESAVSTDAILAPLEDIHVRKEVVIHRL